MTNTSTFGPVAHLLYWPCLCDRESDSSLWNVIC